jgi:hypothetical protein
VGQHRLTPHGTAYGWNCTGQFKVIGQRNEPTLQTVMSRVFALFPQGKRLSVSGYDSSWCDEFQLQPTIKTVLDNVVTIEVPAILRVIVND